MADTKISAATLRTPQAGDMVPLAATGGNTTAYKAYLQPATTAARGIVELATDAETQAGTSTSLAVTPANLAATTMNVINVKSYGATGDGVTDDTTAIQAAIAAISNGDVIYFPSGVYVISKCLEVLGHDDITIIGDGIGHTILNASASTSLARTDYTPDAEAVIIFDASTDASVQENLFVRNLEIKGNNSGDYKAVLFGTIKNFGCEYVKVYGSGQEAFDHIDYWSGATKRAKNFVVRFCEFEDLDGSTANAINVNSTGLVGFDFSHNYIHESKGGSIYAIGKAGIIANNLFVEAGRSACIQVINESPVAVEMYHQGIVISNNVIREGCKNSDVVNLGLRAIWAQSVRSSTTFDDSLLIANNIIEGGYGDTSYAFYGIESRGAAIIKGNLIRRISDAHNNSIAILCNNHSLDGAEQHTVVIDGNVLEKTENPYHIGIQLVNDSNYTFYVMNNIIETGAIDTATNHYAFRDMSATKVVLMNNIFNDTIDYQGTALTMTNTPVNSDDLRFATFSDGDASPSVLGYKKFRTANTNDTTITMFDNGYTGQDIFVFFGDSKTTVNFYPGSTYLYGNAGVDYTFKTGEFLRAVCVGSNEWTCEVHKTIA